MARMILTLAICGGALAITPAAAQEDTTGAVPLVAPAPYDTSTAPAQTLAPQAEPVVESKAAENPPPEKATQSETVESKPAESKPDEANAEAKATDKADGRFTFSRVDDGYVRLDNRTGQVSFCSKHTVGWTCQLVPEDRGVLENEISHLQEENATLKRELLTQGLPLPGSMKGEPPVARNEQPFGLPGDANLERMKVMVEKAWRRLVDMISALQKDVLKKS